MKLNKKMVKEDLIQKIIKLGLKEKEALVYLSLLKFDKAPISKISRETGLTKQNLYNYLNYLRTKNLVGELAEGGVRFFFAKDMDIFKETLMSEIERKICLSEEISEKLEDYKIKSASGFKCYYGRQNIGIAFVEQIGKQQEGASLMAIEGQDLDFINILMNGNFELYEKIRIENKIWINVLMVVNDYADFRNYKTIVNHSRIYDETRVVNKDKAMFDFLGLYIWDDGVWFLIRENNDYEMMKIMNKNLARGFRFYFDLVWKQAVVFYKSSNTK